MATITKVGSYTGTGAALNVAIGFVPDMVCIVNTTTPAKDEWFQGMAAGTSITVTGTAAVRAAPGGVTAFEGSAVTSNASNAGAAFTGVGQGFSVGAALSVTGNVYRYVAIQTGPAGA